MRRFPCGTQAFGIRTEYLRAGFSENTSGAKQSKADGEQSHQPFLLCAEHARQLGGESSLDNLMEVKSSSPFLKLTSSSKEVVKTSIGNALLKL